MDRNECDEKLLVSVITAAYNSESFLLDTYQSLRSQTYQAWEWVVVDDCSTDSTFELLEELSQKDDRIRLFRNSKNEGAAHSRNLAIDCARGEFLAFLDSDDLWLPNKLAHQLSYMAQGVDFSFTAYRVVDELGNETGRTIDHLPQPAIYYEDLLNKKVTMGCSTVVIRRGTVGDLRMPLIRAGQDYAFWLSILRAGNSAFLLPEVLTSYRVRKGSLSRNKFYKARQQWHIYRNIENLPVASSALHFSFYAFRAVFR